MTEILTFDFTPLTPVRADHVGEVVYAKKWQKLHGGERREIDRWLLDDTDDYRGYPILDIAHQFRGFPTERDCRVASSFVVWLGTSTGQCYLHSAQKRAAPLKRGGVFCEWQDAYRFEWMKENTRHHMVNHGLTRAETITMQPGFQIDLSARDVEVMGLTAGWLGTDAGQTFIEKCQTNIKLKHERQREAELTAFCSRPVRQVSGDAPAPA